VIASLATLSLALAVGAGPQLLAVDPAASAVRYHVNHKLHEVDGVSRRVEGKAVLEPDGAFKAMVRIAVQSFDSGDANRDSHMLETLEAGQHPYVTFKGTGAVAQLAPGSKPSELTLRGELELHGVKRPVEVPVTVEFAADGSVQVKGRLAVSLEAHRIERPSLLMMKLDDECIILFDLKLGRAG
jgi:polyisoprenoid-binding protein YceI